MRVLVPWPRYPTVTATGRPSGSKFAGRPIPWLSANVVNRLPHPVYEQAKIRWRDAAAEAAEASGWRIDGPRLLDIVLVKRTANSMDPFAILEGVKPLIDGFVRSGMMAGDDERYVRGGLARATKSANRWLGVVVFLLPV